MNGSPHPSRQSRIDYIFVSAGLAAAVVASDINDKALGSDHFPVSLELRYNP
jgi:exonuclease III